MKKKTYGVNGFLEWIANISAGSASLHVPFTGGAVTKYGIVPAEYTTSDPVIQHLIENSRQYHDKLIFLIREGEIKEKKSRHTGDNPESMVTIEVSHLTDAAEILRDRCGVPAFKVSSAEEAKRIGREHNIKFKGI